jgi:hypothetical protein
MWHATIESAKLRQFLLDNGAVLSVSIQAYLEG